MNADLKQQIEDVLAEWHNSDDDLFSFEETGDRMAALLQELADAPEAEPFAVIHLDGSFVHVEFKQTIAGTGKFEVYAAPPAPSVPDGWRIVPYTPTVQMLERAEYAVNNRPQPSKYEPSATPAIIFWNAMLNYAPEAPAVQADLRDAELLDWLQNNFYHRQMSDWDARQRSGQNMWVFFAPKTVQSDVREVLRAAIAAEKGGTR